MLNYRNTSAVVITLTFVYFVFGFYHSFTFTIIYCLLVLSYLFMLVLGASRIQMNFFLKALHNGNPDKAMVAFSFDDGPDKKYTEELLDILEKHKIKAAFFLIGHKIKGNEKTIKRINKNGHLTGNHTWSHSVLFDFYLPSIMIQEIENTDSRIKEITGNKVKLFRPPYGVTNPFLSKALKKTGHTVIGWSLRTFDTNNNSRKVLNKINTRLKNGDIILFHDTNPNTLILLNEIILLVKQKGFEIVGLEELLEIK